MSEVTKLVVISDLHCGSSVGLCPPEFEYDIDEGMAIKANRAQLHLWDQWIDFTESWLPSILGDSAYCLLVNGDLVDGLHHRSTQVHSDEIVHSRIAEHVLMPLAEKAERVFISKGTEAHTHSYESAIAAKLGCDYHSATNTYAPNHILLEMGGLTISAQHHITASSRSWLGGYALLASLVDEQYRAASRGHTIPDIIIRSHRHVYASFSNSAGMCIVTPPWQMLTRFGRMVTKDMVSECGGLVLDFAGCENGELPIVRTRLYRSKETEIQRV